MNKLPNEIRNPFTTDIKYISIPEHAVLILKKKWRQFILTVLAVFGVAWTLVESGSFFLKLDLSGKYYYSALGFISFISASVHVIFSYLRTAPIGLENQPFQLQRIAILKKPFWEYRFAYSLLKNKLSEIDKHLMGVLNGHVYIEISKKTKIREYIEWIQLRPTNLLNMVDIAKRLLVYELPTNLIVNNNSEISYDKLIACIERLKDLYEKACDYEIEGREIEPPEGFQEIHRLQSGWSKVIREAIKQSLEILDKISNFNKKKLNDPVEFTILFDEPEGTKEFEIELEKIAKSLPELFLKETLP